MSPSRKDGGKVEEGAGGDTVVFESDNAGLTATAIYSNSLLC